MGCAASKPPAPGDWNKAYEALAHHESKERRSATRRGPRRGESLSRKEASSFVKKNAKDNHLEMVNDYTLGKTLGKGAFGEGQVATRKGQKFAIKILKKSALKKMRTGRTGSALDGIKTEIATMKKIAHPNCVHMYDVILDPNQDEIFLVLEFVNGGTSQSKDADDNPIPIPEQTIWSHLVHPPRTQLRPALGCVPSPRAAPLCTSTCTTTRWRSHRSGNDMPHTTLLRSATW